MRDAIDSATQRRLVDEGDGVAAIPDADIPVLAADLARETLERIRR